MVEHAAFLSASLGLLVMALFTCFSVVSAREGEGRAARVFFVAAVAGAGPLFLASMLPLPFPLVALSIAALVVVAALIRCVFPLRRTMEPGGRATRRVDERDIMFARGRLRPDSPEFDAYYRMRPENVSSDNHTRSLPGLLSLDAEKAEPLAFAAADAAFKITEVLRGEVNGPIATVRRQSNPVDWTLTVKDLARRWGAVDVRVAALEPEHIYTHIGRGTGLWGS